VRDHVESMSDKRPTEVLSALPRTRPHRRSEKRADRPPSEGAGGVAEPTAGGPREDAPARRAGAAGKRAEAAGPRGGAAKPARTADVAAAKGSADAATTPQPPRAGAARPLRPAITQPRKTGAGATQGRGRGGRPAPKAERLRQPPQPAGVPPTPRSRKPAPVAGADILGTAVQAAAELAEIGLSVSARALRNAVSRLPKP
jgi:hypothetical protein